MLTLRVNLGSGSSMVLPSEPLLNVLHLVHRHILGNLLSPVRILYMAVLSILVSILAMGVSLLLIQGRLLQATTRSLVVCLLSTATK